MGGSDDVSELPSLETLSARFAKYGLSDDAYLRTHYPRMVRTVRLFEEEWSCEQGDRVLDLGAHWLHLAALFAHRGYRVVAADFPVTIEQPSVIALAEELGVERLTLSGLEQPDCLAEVSDASVDVVVLAEVLEHLAFNPRGLWREVARVLKPGGRVVLTTPNYYSLVDRLRSAVRFVTGRGGSLSVDKVLDQATYGHHWKEYSPYEIRRYVDKLGGDFAVHRLIRTDRGARKVRPRTMMQGLLWLIWTLAPGLRRDLHVELVRVGLESH